MNNNVEDDRFQKIAPVFIGGCERSGTTMLGSMLGAHSDSICTPESQFIRQFFRDKSFDPGAINAVDVLTRIQNHKRYLLEWKGALDFSAEKIPGGLIDYNDFLKWTALCYAESQEKKDISWWIDQTPNNMRRAVTLLDLFPEAKFIHLVRDGRAVAASLIPLEWGPSNILRAAEYWLSKIAPGLAVESSFSENQVMRVYYEDLLKQPETTLKNICRFTGIPYEEKMISTRGYKPSAYNQKQHSLVSSGLNTSRVSAWKNKLSVREIEIFEFITGETLKLFGYEQVYGLRARPISKKELGRFQMNTVYNRVKNILRQRVRVQKGLKGDSEQP